MLEAYGHTGEGNTQTVGACGLPTTAHVDPVTGLAYATETGNGRTLDPTGHGPNGFVNPPADYIGFDPATAPNNGEGFAKNVGGNQLPNAPHFTVSLSGEYTMPVSEDWAATLHSDFYWQSQSFARVFNDRPYDKIRGYSTTNLALILTSASGWQVMGYVKNVFDVTAITGAFLNPRRYRADHQRVPHRSAPLWRAHHEELVSAMGKKNQSRISPPVMAALVAATHTLRLDGCSWVAGTSPAMTKREALFANHHSLLALHTGGNFTMSELIQNHDNRATIRWKLLTGASALALTAYISSTALAKADDADRPTIWIELGGQMEQLQGFNAPFTSDFMSITPTPDVYKGAGFISNQNAPRFSFGEEASIRYQPENSDWIFSAGIRYGRSHARRHKHKEGPQDAPILVTYSTPTSGYVLFSSVKYFSSKPLADIKTHDAEHHLILDFQAGKDVGLGLFGRNGSSTINAGVRLASFKNNSSVFATGRPEIGVQYRTDVFGSILPLPVPTFHQYLMSGQAERSFQGIGPELSWNASAALAGNTQDGELTLDWGSMRPCCSASKKRRPSTKQQPIISRHIMRTP